MQIKSGQEFQECLANAGDKLVVVDFFATWCGPCRTIAPVLEELGKENADSLVVIKVDIDEVSELAEEYDIKSLPTFVFLKGGKKIEEFSGANSDKLRNTIAKLK